MSGINKVILIGNVGRDPETRSTTGGTSVVSFSIATSEKWKNKSGDSNEKTEWHNCVAFGRTAEIISQYVRKGDKLYAEGKLSTSSWDDKDGNRRYKTEIIVSHIEMLGSKLRDNVGGPGAGSASASQKSAVIEDDDLPF